MSRLKVTQFLIISTLLSLTIGCEKEYYRIQASNISEAKIAMGGAGVRSSLTETNDGFRNRVELNFRGRDINDNDLDHLRNLDGIIGLDLSNTKISDKGLKVLLSLPDLEYLQLGDTGITDEGIMILSAAANLKRLDIRRTRVTDRAKELFLSFPKLEVVFSKGTSVDFVEHVETNAFDELSSFWGTAEQ